MKNDHKKHKLEKTTKIHTKDNLPKFCCLFILRELSVLGQKHLTNKAIKIKFIEKLNIGKTNDIKL